VKQSKGLQNEKQQRLAELAELDAQKQSLKRTVASLQEKLDKAVLQHRVKEDSMKCQLNELQKYTHLTLFSVSCMLFSCSSVSALDG